MKKIKVRFGWGGLFCTILIVVACGGGGGGSAPPQISDFTSYPSWTTQDASEGWITVRGSLYFSDPDGDISLFNLKVYDSGSNLINSTDVPIQGANVITAGYLSGEVMVGIAETGDFRFEVLVADSGGRVSNTLDGIFFSL